MQKSNKIIGRARVLFPFKAQNRDELNLKVQDVVNVLQKDLPDKGWWLGELNGVAGVFPDNFVRLLPNSPEQPKKNIQRSQNAIRESDSTTSDFDDMKATSKKLTHITATRVKGPQRRLPSRLLAKNDSSSSSIVSVISNKKIDLSTNSEVFNGSVVSSKNSFNEHLDSCWGNAQDSPDTTSTSPRVFSSDSPEPSQATPVLKNISKHARNLSRFSNGSKEGPPWKRDSPIGRGNHFFEKGDLDQRAAGDKRKVEGLCSSSSGNLVGLKKREGIRDSSSCGELLSMEAYQGVVKKIEALRRDIKDQTQTNERMVQTLRNFLQEEKIKVKHLSLEFARLRSLVINDITFL